MKKRFIWMPILEFTELPWCNSFRRKWGIMSSIYNYGAYDLAVAEAEVAWARLEVGDGHRKMTRPDRLSLCRWGGRGVSSSKMLMSWAGAAVLNRRFGARDTRAGNLNASVWRAAFGSE